MTALRPPHPSAARHRLRAPVVALALIACAAVAGCSASNTSGSSPQAAPADGKNFSMPEAAGGAGAADYGGAADQSKQNGSAPQAQAPAQVAPQQQALIYTGTISITVGDVAKQADEAASIATGLGGSVESEKRMLDADRSESVIVLRVPSAKFDAALTAVSALGTESDRSVTTQDVTDQLIDLDARLATQRASVERVRALLAQAKTIGEVVSIESELTRRQADLDSLEQRQAKLSGLVAMSTITASIRGKGAPPPVAKDPDRGFLGGLRSGWAAFVGSIKVVLVVAGWLLPWLIGLGLPVWLVLWLLRRRRPATAAPIGAPPTLGVPALATPATAVPATAVPAQTVARPAPATESTTSD